jgi:hypothetical protein
MHADTDSCEEEWSVEFDEPTEQLVRGHLDSRMKEYRARATLHVIAALLVVIGVVTTAAGLGYGFAFWLSAAAIAIAAATEMIWRKTDFCGNCGAAIWLPHKLTNCPGCNRLIHPRDCIPWGDNGHALKSPQWRNHDNPYVKMVGILLRYTFDGTISRLVLRKHREHFRIAAFRSVSDVRSEYELEEPPSFCFEPVVQILAAMSDLDSRSSYPQTGRMNVQLDHGTEWLGVRIDKWNVQVTVCEPRPHLAEASDEREPEIAG